MNQKFALIIGNSEYDDKILNKLKSPEADVRALAEILRDPAIGGFDTVTTCINQLESSIRRTIGEFFYEKKPDDLLLFYFSGHGVIDDNSGRLFLAVKDTKRDLLRQTAIATALVTEEMNVCRSKRQILILDCCHSGAFAEGAKGDIKVINESTFKGNGYGHVVLTASNSTQSAWEGDRIIEKAELSLFTHFLINGLKSGEADKNGDGQITLDELYDFVHEHVRDQTPNQTPQMWEYKTQGELVIARNPHPKLLKPAELPSELRKAVESPLAGLRAGAVEELSHLLRGSDKAMALAATEALMRLKEDDSRKVSDAAAAVLAAQTQGSQPSVQLAQPPVDKIVKPDQPLKSATTEKIVVFPPSEKIPTPLQIVPQITVIERPIHLELVCIPAGDFLMGSDPAKDKRAGYHDQPQHLVSVSEFLISRYPINNAEYAAFVLASGYACPGYWQGGKVPDGKEKHPVVLVSWHDAVAFSNWLSKESLQSFRLPTEAEWEKAARGIDGRIYPWGNEWDQTKLNCKASGTGETTAVGKYSPAGDSPYGNADMVGNIWEWCLDWFAEKEYWRRYNNMVKDPQGPEQNISGRVIRGGSFQTDNPHVRCAFRGQQEPSTRLNHLGFRVVTFTRLH